MSAIFKTILVGFSYIFHPIFIALYCTLISHFFLESFNQFYKLIGLLVVFTIALPLISLFILIRLKIMDSFTEAKLNQRGLILFIQLIFSLVFIYVFINMDFRSHILLFYLGGILSSILAYIGVYFKLKVSLHMIGISALTAFVILFQHYSNFPKIQFVVLFLIICCGLVGSSRLYLNSHTKSELFLGILVGIIPQGYLFYLLSLF